MAVNWWDSIQSALIGTAATGGNAATAGILGSGGNISWSNLASLASTGYDIYQGMQKQQQANRMYDLMYGSATAQDTWAELVKARYQNIYWPYEEQQYTYATEDRVVVRASDVAARDYNVLRKYQQITQAQVINPTLDSAEIDLINLLVDPITSLRARLANDAVLGVNQSFEATRTQDTRRLNVLGVNPSSGARLVYNRSLANAQALASATARNQAAIIAEDTFISRHGQAMAYRAGVPLPTYQTTPTVTAGNVTTSLSSSGSIAATAGGALDTNAQQSFTGAATALNSMYMRPYMERYMDSISTTRRSPQVYPG